MIKLKNNDLKSKNRSKGVKGFVVLALCVQVLIILAVSCMAGSFVVNGETHTMYREFVVDSSMVSGTQTGIPLELSVVQDAGITSDAGNVRITDSNDNPLPSEIESYDSATGELTLWFKADINDASDTTFKMYFGNMSLTEPAADSTYGSQAVWDSNYVGVWHMNQEPNGNEAGSIKDSTSNSKHMTPSGYTVDSLVDGSFGKAIYFDGSNDLIDNPDLPWKTMSILMNREDDSAYSSHLVGLTTSNYRIYIPTIGCYAYTAGYFGTSVSGVWGQYLLKYSRTV